MTKELKCSCEHEQQDKIYGKKIRLHNLNGSKTKAICTVCGNIKQIKL